MRDWLNQHSNVQGWNVFTALVGGAYAENYSNKHLRWQYNDTVNQNDPEVQRLSDDRAMQEAQGVRQLQGSSGITDILRHHRRSYNTPRAQRAHDLLADAGVYS